MKRLICFLRGHGIALPIAKGHLEQAREWLDVAAGRQPRQPTHQHPPLVTALEHMRTACSWLMASFSEDY